MVVTPKGSSKPRRHVLFDPFGVGIDFARCSVGSTHGYSPSGPFGAGLSKRQSLIQWQWGRGEGERSSNFTFSASFESSRAIRQDRRIAQSLTHEKIYGRSLDNLICREPGLFWFRSNSILDK